MPLLKPYIKQLAFIVFLLLTQKLSAQVYPAEGADVFALKVPLKIDRRQGITTYVFKIAEGLLHDNESFRKGTFLPVRIENNIAIADLSSFDKPYSWMAEGYAANGEKILETDIYHFRARLQKQENYRLRVIENKYTDSTLSFFVDYTNSLFQLSGNVTWQLPPEIPGMKGRNQKNDIKISPENTITFLANGNAYEVDYAGNLLWQEGVTREQAASDTRFSYHHQFTRLKSGNYMVLGSEVLSRVIPAQFLESKKGDSVYRGIDFGVLAEYNAKNELVWIWRSSDHFASEELFKKKQRNGKLYPGTHMNAFYLDETEGVVYCGFRDINRIVKIKYPEKKILAEYSVDEFAGDAYFQKQHSIRKDSDDNLLIFNNRNGSMAQMDSGSMIIGEDPTDSIASVVIYKESQHKRNKLEKVWEYNCVIDSETSPISVRGGSFRQLRDGNYFVCMGGTPRIFIINKQKEILYNAVVERWSEQEMKWELFPQYRATPVYSDELEKVIYKSVATN